MDSRKCQTSTATPPEAGGLPWVARIGCIEQKNRNMDDFSKPCSLRKIAILKSMLLARSRSSLCCCRLRGLAVCEAPRLAWSRRRMSSNHFGQSRDVAQSRSKR